MFCVAGPCQLWPCQPEGLLVVPAPRNKGPASARRVDLSVIALTHTRHPAFVLELLQEMLGEWTAEPREEPNRSNVYYCANPVCLPSNALQSATHCLHVIPIIILACFQDAPDLMEAARQADGGGMEHGDPGDHGDHGDAAESLRQQRSSTRNALHLCLRFLQDRDL
jgi:hypothetical protein